MSRRLEDLHPTLQPLCRTFLDRCKSAGLDVRLTFTHRTQAEQDKLYAQGRTAPGPIVTSVRVSKHTFSIDGKPAAKAFDFGVFDRGKYVTDGRDPRYTHAGLIGEALGLTWGGRWKKPFDPGHLEIA